MDTDIEKMVAEIEARAEKATPGPWSDLRIGSLGNGSARSAEEQLCNSKGVAVVILTHDGSVEAMDNVEFVSHAREDVPKLCAMWREAVAERDALRADATLWRNGMKVIDELRAAVIPCGHTVGDLIGGHGAVTKCGACLASIREHRATLATRLKAAIRRQTVDVDDGNTPNGPVEQAMETIANILNSTTLVATAKTSRRMLIETFVRLTAAMAADCKELREAADAYFGEDFTQPPPPPTQP